MKLRQTEFFKQFTSVVAGTFLLVMTYAFIEIPLTLNASVAGLQSHSVATQLA
ncbi:hypothetical protein GPA22_12180 [Aromatoleum toluvorans]|uniref:MFS transporter n=1 Tax=Aromatoleum toluvorans TaxID=92002 RepID=A0ABX1Q160_9RHOO|nr:hypothetical protein [Aromatoleum toluvorans]NMG44486.1 hypothetical protein [Aromatoleum toluvorans]